MKRPTINSDLEEVIPHLISAWRRFTKEGGPPDVLQTREFRKVVEGVKSLKAGLEENGELLGQSYFDQPELLGAYLLYPWIMHYLEAFSLMGELPNPPKRVLDVCSGPIPMGFAALKRGASELWAIDRHLGAMTLGADICGRYGYPVNIRRWECQKNPLPVEGTFDLIILGYCLEELFPKTDKRWAEKQQSFLNDLLARLTPDGNLLMVESSLGEFNKRILECRDRFVQDSIAIQAPCVWRGECPALKTQNSPCYAQREFEKPYLIKEIQRAASINLSSLKMSYLIVKSPQAQWPSLPSQNLYRIISPPFESHLGKSFYLCGTDGKKRLSPHVKQIPKEAKAFEFLRRGELIQIENSLDSNTSLEIVEGTTLKIAAACGKPLPECNLKEEDV